MKSLLTKIISTITIFCILACLCGCANKTSEPNCNGDHTWKLASTTATCYDSGVESYICEICKETKTENVEAYGHNYVLTSRTDPTCKTNGEEVKKCSRCGFESKQTLLIVDHDYQVKSTTPSTCTTHGSQLVECSMCHETKTETLELKDHTFELVNTTPSTCIIHGSNQYKCKDCTATKSEELPFAEHKYETQPVEATCFTHGGTVKKCSVCQDQKPVNETPLLTHNFGADGYCEHCGIYETLFDETKLNVTITHDSTSLGTIRGYLVPLFKNNNGTVSDTYFADQTITLTLTLYDKDSEVLTEQTFTSNLDKNGKLTIGADENSTQFANRFRLLLVEDNRFSDEVLTKSRSFKIAFSSNGYKDLEYTYQLTELN